MEGLYMLGTGFSEWKKGDALTVTFQMRGDYDQQESILTARRGRMTWETAKKFADYVLSEEMEYVPKLIVEFAGIEDYAEIDLMEWLSGYFVDRMANRNQSIRFRLCAGLEVFQFMEIWKYLRKYENRIEVELVLHDFRDIKESVLYLWEKGVAGVFVHMEPDEEAGEGIFEGQLKELADYALENQLFRRCSCNFFEEEMTGCGWTQEENAFYGFRSSGIMLTPSGKVYSLSRSVGCSCEKREKRLAGSMEAGVDPERMRPFCVVPDLKNVESEEALQLERIRANEYYFAQLWARYRIRREKGPKLQRMFIPLDNCRLSPVSCKNPELGSAAFMDEVLERSLAYCEKNGVEAVLIHPVDGLVKIDEPRLERMRNIHIVSSAFGQEAAIRYANVAPVAEERMLEAKKEMDSGAEAEEAAELSELAVWNTILEEAALIGNWDLAAEGRIKNSGTSGGTGIFDGNSGKFSQICL